MKEKMNNYQSALRSRASSARSYRSLETTRLLSKHLNTLADYASTGSTAVRSTDNLFLEILFCKIRGITCLQLQQCDSRLRQFFVVDVYILICFTFLATFTFASASAVATAPLVLHEYNIFSRSLDAGGHV
jgi:hypothetical protein